ncbi:MAG: hypothetical protein E6J91_34355 [Deltaproteobacteria bacterium]|nr:MAG: hypothetical protein E6J91_34355 [Deltaproteobacteria bacterium]
MARWLATLALIAAVLWSYGTLRGRRRPGASRAAKPVQILYLRPFDTDEGVEYKTKRFGGIPVADPDAMRTFDEEICDAFHSFGRITALVPRNADPVPIGPDKVVFTPEGDDWHVFIETALGQARLVVLVLGRSASMLWELQTALRVVNRAQLLLVAPPGGIQTVWGQVSPVLTAAGWNIAPTPGCRLIVHGADGPHEFSGPTPYHDALGAVGRALTQGD